jgi:flagellar basal body-associated protein FliL
MRRRLLLACLPLLLALPAMADDAAPPAKAEHKLTEAKSYLEIDPFYTTIIDDNRPAGMLMVGIGLDVPDDALRAVVTRSMPVLRDAYLRNLAAFTATNVRSTAQPDVGVLAGRLQAVTDRALGKKGARILLAQVALRITK